MQNNPFAKLDKKEIHSLALAVENNSNIQLSRRTRINVLEFLDGIPQSNLGRYMARAQGYPAEFADALAPPAKTAADLVEEKAAEDAKKELEKIRKEACEKKEPENDWDPPQIQPENKVGSIGESAIVPTSSKKVHARSSLDDKLELAEYCHKVSNVSTAYFLTVLDDGYEIKRCKGGFRLVFGEIRKILKPREKAPSGYYTVKNEKTGQHMIEYVTAMDIIQKHEIHIAHARIMRGGHKMLSKLATLLDLQQEFQECEPVKSGAKLDAQRAMLCKSVGEARLKESKAKKLELASGPPYQRDHERQVELGNVGK